MLPASPAYTKPGCEALAAEMASPRCALRGVSLPGGKLTRWDGLQGTYAELLDRAFEEVKQASGEGKEGWSRMGSKHGVEFEFHPERTAKGNGNRFFRLRGVLKVHPALVVCGALSPVILGSIDETVRHMKVVHDFPDGKSRLLTVCAEAGPRPLFYDRDDLSLSCYYREGETWYQISTSVPDHTACASTAVRDHTMYWGYKLEPFVAEDGSIHSRTTLISQTEIFGWIPKFLVNIMIPPVLVDYMRSLEEYLAELTKRGAPARQLLESFGINVALQQQQ